jgi:hypothetical protein
MAVFILNSESECFLDVATTSYSICLSKVKSPESSDNFGCCGHRFKSLCYRTTAKQKALAEGIRLFAPKHFTPGHFTSEF